MANYSSLKAAIEAAIKTNGNQEITGQVLQDVLTSIVSVIGANYTFAGVATPSTNPGTPDQNLTYLAMEGGTYTNFNGTVLPAGISLLMWNGTWTSETVMYGDGGVFDISVYKSSGGTLATYADLSAALDGGNNIPASARKGGMSVKYVQSSDNNSTRYVQYRYMGTATTGSPNPFLDTANWQGVDDEPVAGSDNLVKSGGINAALLRIKGDIYDAASTCEKENLEFHIGTIDTSTGEVDSSNNERCHAFIQHVFTNGEKFNVINNTNLVNIYGYRLYNNSTFYQTTSSQPGTEIVCSGNWNRVAVVFGKQDSTGISDSDILVASSGIFGIYGSELDTFDVFAEKTNANINQIENTKNNKLFGRNLFDKKTCDVGHVFDQNGNLTSSSYWSLSVPIYVKEHRNEYLVKNKTANAANRYSKFVLEDGSETTFPDTTNPVQIPSNAVYVIMAMYMVHAKASDLDDAQVEYGHVCTNYEDYSPIKGYEYDIIVDKEDYIPSGGYKKEMPFTNTEEQQVFAYCFGLTNPTIVFYKADYTELGRTKLSNIRKVITIPASTARITVTLGSDNIVNQDTYFRLYGIVPNYTFADELFREDIESLYDEIGGRLSIGFAPAPQEDRHSDYQSTINTQYIQNIFDDCAQKFNDYIDVIDLGADASGLYRVKGYKINFANEPKFKILIICNQHGGSAGGDQVMGGYVATQFISDICGYKHRNNSVLKWIRENVSINIIPVANPWGVDNFSRYNYNGVDLNRNWPTSGWSSDTSEHKGSSAGDQPEVQHCLTFINAVHPDIIVDNHTLGGFDGQSDGNSGQLIMGFVKDYLSNGESYNGYFARLKSLLQKEYLLNLTYTYHVTTDDTTPDLRVWSYENGYFGGLIEMQWRDPLDSDNGFTSNIIEASYTFLLGIYQYYKQQ